MNFSREMLVWLKVFPSGLRGLEVTLTVLQAPYTQGSITAQRWQPLCVTATKPPIGSCLASRCNSNNDLQTPKESKFIAVPLTATTSPVCEQKGSCCQWQSRCPGTWSPRPTQPDTTGPSRGRMACSSPARPTPLAGPGHQPWGLRLPAAVSQQTSTVAHEPGGVTFTGARWARKSHLMMPEQGPSCEDCPSGGGTGRSTAAHRQTRGEDKALISVSA